MHGQLEGKKGRSSSIGGQIIVEEVFEDEGVEAVSLQKGIVRVVGEHEEHGEAEHKVLERVQTELGHGGREAGREEGGERGRAARDLRDDALRQSRHGELVSENINT